MALNANVFVKKPGFADGSTEDVELPADFIAALQATEAATVIIQTPKGTGPKYLVTQIV